MRIKIKINEVKSWANPDLIRRAKMEKEDDTEDRTARDSLKRDVKRKSTNYLQLQKDLVRLYIYNLDNFKQAFIEKFGKNYANNFRIFLKALEYNYKESRGIYGNPEATMEMKTARHIFTEFYNEIDPEIRREYMEFINKSDSTSWED